jgi:hypothetical protein
MGVGRFEKCFGGETWGIDHLENRGVDGVIIVKWIFRKCLSGYEIVRLGLGYVQLVFTLECGNKNLGCMK